MSKIGKKSINVPDKVEVKINAGSVSIKGPNGEFTRDLPDFLVPEIKDNLFTLASKGGDKGIEKKRLALWGLNRALLSNMIKGAKENFEKKLEFQGVGYKASVKGKNLELHLGYSHPIVVEAVDGITFKVEKNVITVMGANKQLVGEAAANIRSKRKPEPYKGSGIRYMDEIVRRKAGKKAATTG
jgi:large subunit ribosomal protein L6